MEPAAILENEEHELSCVVIPTSGQYLLLPNVCVAEIMPWRRIKVLDGGPAWCLGFMGWRGLTLPVVHYGGFNDPDQPVRTPRCLIVMNRARTTRGIDFYALVADSMPRMVQLLGEDLSNHPGSLGVADVMQVSLGTDVVAIPDLEYVENRVTSLVERLKNR